MSEATKLKLRILNTEIQVSCKLSEQDALETAAKFINEEMQNVKQKTNTRSTEKIAIITAMNLAHELLELRKQSASVEKATDKITNLNKKLTTALEK